MLKSAALAPPAPGRVAAGAAAAYSTPSRGLASLERRLRGSALSRGIGVCFMRRTYKDHKRRPGRTSTHTPAPARARLRRKGKSALAVQIQSLRGALPKGGFWQMARDTRFMSCQNEAPNTLWFPWKFPETKTQSAGDPLVSLWVGCRRKLSYRPTHDPNAPSGVLSEPDCFSCPFTYLLAGRQVLQGMRGCSLSLVYIAGDTRTNVHS